MSLLERDSVLVSTTENGDPVVDLPFTRVNNVEGIGRSPNTTYSVDDVVYTDNNMQVALKCTTAGATSNTELDISGNNIGDTVTDGSVVWKVCNRTSDVTSVNGKTGDVVVDLPVGHMYWSVEPTVPAGRLPALGATYNRALYADLWEWANSVGLVISESEWQSIAQAQDGNCRYYSDGDGSTTFRVPSIKCWVKGASSVEEVGSYLQAGLPNVTASLDRPVLVHLNAVSGAFNFTIKDVCGVDSSRNHKQGVLDFDASRCSSVYRDDIDTVQPPSIVGMWLIVAFGIAHNIGEADVANVMQAVEQVQTGLGTLEQGVGTAIDYIIESYRNGTEWYEVYKSGKVRQGGRILQASANTKFTVTLLKEMANVNYQVYCQCIAENINDEDFIGPYNYQTNNFGMCNGSGTKRDIEWKCEGQGA